MKKAVFLFLSLTVIFRLAGGGWTIFSVLCSQLSLSNTSCNDVLLRRLIYAPYCRIIKCYKSCSTVVYSMYHAYCNT